MPSRWTDPEKARGNLEPGEIAFGLSDALVETGLPLERSYDYQVELARIRSIYRAEAAGQRAPRPPSAKYQSRSLRRCS